MHQIDFSKPGGFPLEQNTLAKMQTAYKDQLFMAFKKHLGVEETKNYLLFPGNAVDRGWAIIQGELIPITPTANPTAFLQVKESKRALIFRSGAKHKVFVTWEGSYVTSIPANPVPVKNTSEETVHTTFYKLDDLQRITNIPDLGNLYLTLDGSNTMKGDLNLGGHKLSALNVKEGEKAFIRAKELWFGHSELRGKAYPKKPLGRALVDTGSSLSINHEADWENVHLHGEVSMSGLAQSTRADQHPVLLDADGKLMKSSGRFIGSVVLGMIALWHQTTIPAGWILCDGYLGRSVNGFNIPDLRSEFMGPVRYIMYVGVYNKYPLVQAGTDQSLELPWKPGIDYAVLEGTSTDEDGTIASTKWTYTSVPPGLPCAFETPNALKTKIRGLRPGVYQFKLTATDNEGLSWFDQMTLTVTENQAPIIDRIDGTKSLTVVRGTSSTRLTIVARDPEKRTLSYQWKNAAGTVIGTEAAIQLTGLGVQTHRFVAVVTDDRGARTSKEVIVTVAKIKKAPKVSVNANQTIQLPTNSVNLSATVSDENQDALSVRWTKVSGGGATISSPTSTATSVTNLQEGSYVFRVTVTDVDGMQAQADTNVLVKKALVAPTISDISIARIPGRNGAIRVTATGNDADGANGNLTYHWTESTMLPKPIRSASFDVAPNQLAPGYHNFSVFVTDSDGLRSRTAMYKEYPHLTIRIVHVSSTDSKYVFRVVLKGPPNYGDDNITLGVQFKVLEGNGVLIDRSGSGLGMSSNGSRTKTFADMSSTGEISLNFELSADVVTRSSIRAEFTLRGMSTSASAVSKGIKCFDVTTTVPLYDGGEKRLGDVEVGDTLIGLDYPNRIDASEGDYMNWKGRISEGTLCPVTVLRKSTFVVDEYLQISLANDQHIRVTAAHPVLTCTGGDELAWIKPMDLRKGMSLLAPSGNTIDITEVLTVEEPIEVAVLDVESVDNFSVGGIVAHNAEINEHTGDPKK